MDLVNKKVRKEVKNEVQSEVHQHKEVFQLEDK